MDDQRNARMDWSARHPMMREYRVSAADWAELTSKPRAVRITFVKRPDGTVEEVERVELECEVVSLGPNRNRVVTREPR